MNTVRSLVCYTAVCLTLAGLASAREVPRVKPTAEGMNMEKLSEVNGVVDKLIGENKLAGAVVAISRNGKVVHFSTHGMRDRAGKVAMTKDTIFRIYSMTKAITTAAAMMLFDDGKFALDDPVSKYAPEFKELKVHKKDGNVRPEREMTVRDLMRHTSGLTYGFFGSSAVDKMYQKARVLDERGTLEDMVQKLGDLPLAFDPGTDWTYSVASDVLGRLVEIWSGQTLEKFFQERVFDPLHMKDTGFHVPEEKLDRFAVNYSPDGVGGLRVNDTATEASKYSRKPTFLSGGGGLVSTTRDYLHFLQMIANGGELFGKRLLKKSTVEMMTKNQLDSELMPIKIGLPRPGIGFGLGFSVRVKRSAWDPAGPVGEYGWGGAASTHYWISPKHNLVVVTMEQTMPYSFLLEFALKKLIYDAIEDGGEAAR